MLKGKFKYLILGIGVLIVSLGIMRYTPLAFGGNYGNPGNPAYTRPYNEGFRGPRGNHRMMRDYDEENWEEFRYHNEEFRRGPRGHHRGCMGYFYDDYEFDNGVNK